MKNILHILTVNIIVFFIGALGLVLNKKNILITIMAIELLLLAVNLNFITFSIYLNDIVGKIFVMFILTISATESSIGLSILTTHFKMQNRIQYKKVKFI